VTAESKEDSEKTEIKFIYLPLSNQTAARDTAHKNKWFIEKEKKAFQKGVSPER